MTILRTVAEESFTIFISPSCLLSPFFIGDSQHGWLHCYGRLGQTVEKIDYCMAKHLYIHT